VKWARTACDQNRGQSVAGELRVERLGVKVYFPAGWRRHKTADEVAPIPGVGTGKMLGYYRGGVADDPDLGMWLIVIDNVPEAQLPQSEAEFRQRLDGTASGMGQGGAMQLQLPCEVTELGLRRTGRCVGEAHERGEARRAAVYLFTIERKLVMAIFWSRGTLEKLLPEADDIVGSIERL